ncbi:RidA family protein (plasmid) [Aliisedimentitalea scapharcae]|uniref:RidA family protein n=1 Tax=Aliisedimentitalea scapharcae TaxID=1524259 RepID=A0ABZ2XZP5_9RHOB
MIEDRLKELGYEFEAAPLQILTFHAAVRTGNLVFTSGQIPWLGDTKIQGRVGADVDLELAQKAAEICAFNCIKAAGAVVSPNEITRVVKVLGMVNAAPGFDQMSEVINGASDFYSNVFGDAGFHARSAVGMSLPSDWAVEVETVFEVKAS